MNRRSFFRSLLQGAIAGAALRYMPETLLAPVPVAPPMTLLEAAEQIDGWAAAIADILAAENEILRDMVFIGEEPT